MWCRAGEIHRLRLIVGEFWPMREAFAVWITVFGEICPVLAHSHRERDIDFRTLEMGGVLEDEINVLTVR